MPILYHIDREKGYSLARWLALTTAEEFRAHQRLSHHRGLRRAG